MIREHNEELRRLEILNQLVHNDLITVAQAMDILNDYVGMDTVEIVIETEDTEMSLP